MDYDIYMSGYWVKLAAARPKLGGRKDPAKAGREDGPGGEIGTGKGTDRDESRDGGKN
jgi:hypothetical protein